MKEGMFGNPYFPLAYSYNENRIMPYYFSALLNIIPPNVNLFQKIAQKFILKRNSTRTNIIYTSTAFDVSDRYHHVVLWQNFANVFNLTFYELRKCDSI